MQVRSGMYWLSNWCKLDPACIGCQIEAKLDPACIGCQIEAKLDPACIGCQIDAS